MLNTTKPFIRPILNRQNLSSFRININPSPRIAQRINKHLNIHHYSKEHQHKGKQNLQYPFSRRCITISKRIMLSIIIVVISVIELARPEIREPVRAMIPRIVLL